MQVRTTPIPGLLELLAPRHEDRRGTFTKVFHLDQFKAAGLETAYQEEFVTVSRRGVLRGLHFQVPPHDHVKVVTCLTGTVFDVVVDLRVGSPTFHHWHEVILAGDEPLSLYIPQGLAHGFCATSDDATVLYRTTTVHSPDHDAGILWRSLPIQWPVSAPLTSPRDEAFPAAGEFRSPFNFK